MRDRVVPLASGPAHNPNLPVGEDSASVSADSCDRRASKRPAIFIHSSWRTSSTWFWQKFRTPPTTLCFYEPFNIQLSSISREMAATLNPKSWQLSSGTPAASGHPGASPYYAEFGPLIRRSGGARLYRREMDAEWFLPVGGLRGYLRGAELRYLALLLRLAERNGRTAVLGFTRSLGRLFPMKAHFPGVHIFLRRNLWTQWVSFLDQKRQGNPFFYLSILEMCTGRDDLFLSFVRSYYLKKATTLYLLTRGGREESLQEDALDQKLLLLLPESDVFAMFVVVHIYLYVHAELVADIVVDSTRIATNANYRRMTEQQLADLTGCSVSLSDSLHQQQFVIMDKNAVEWGEIGRQLRFAMRLLPADLDPAQTNRIAGELLAATREEADTSERYLAGARYQISAMATELSSRTGEVLQLRQERDALAQSRDEAIAERDRIIQERDDALRERERLVRAYDVALAEKAQIVQERDLGFRARDEAIAERDHVTKERYNLARANEIVLAEQAALRAEIAEASGRTAALRDQLARLEAESATLRERETNAEAFSVRLQADNAVLRDHLAAAEQR